jgi:hypothetical protein
MKEDIDILEAQLEALKEQKQKSMAECEELRLHSRKEQVCAPLRSWSFLFHIPCTGGA